MRGKGTFIPLQWDETGAATIEVSVDNFEEPKVNLPYNPAEPFLDVCSKLDILLHSYFSWHVHKSQKFETAQCFTTDKWIMKMWHIYYLGVTKNEIMRFVGKWMELEKIILSQVTQTQKDKYCMISFIGSSQLQTFRCEYIESKKVKQDHCREREIPEYKLSEQGNGKGQTLLGSGEVNIVKGVKGKW